MIVSRRGFLAAGSVAALTAALPQVSIAAGLPASDQPTYFAIPQESQLSVLHSFTRSAFAEHLGTKFRISQLGGEPVNVELVEVGDAELNHRSSVTRGREDYFSIIFRAPAGVSAQQGTYTVEHRAMGSFPLFLVPVGMSQDGVTFQAIFNRYIPSLRERIINRLIRTNRVIK